MKSKAAAAILILPLVALAAAAAFLGAGLALTLGGTTQVFGLSKTQEDKANAALSLSQPNLDRAVEAGSDALAQAPMNAAGWARLAYIDQLRAGRLTPDGLSYLERSYVVAPLGPDITAWRLRFAYENWADLTPGLRLSATAELRALTRYRGRAGQAVLEEIQDPVGRFAASLTVALGWQDAEQDRAQRQAAASKVA